MSSIGERIKKIRKEKKLTLAQVAQNQMSSAMVSLIENGKSKPSAENLEHIAKVLGMEMTDLLGGVSREELRNEIKVIRDLSEERLDLEVLQEVIQRIQTLLPDLSNNVESAVIYKMYARCLYALYHYYKNDYDKLTDNDWFFYFMNALEIYEDLQMESNALGIRRSLANIELSKGNYQHAIEIVDQSLQSVKIENSFDTIAYMIDLKIIKVYALAALARVDEIYVLLDEMIQLTDRHLILNKFFVINNLAAMLHYQENNFQEAREFVDKINKFFEIVNNEDQYIDKELNLIHYMEFFESNPEKSLLMLEKIEDSIQTSYLFNEVVEDRVKDMIDDLRARCYTKLNEPEKALPLFRDLMKTYHTEMHPLDVGIRVINKSYQALCYMQLNDQKEAVRLAKEGVSLLRKFPYSAYYHFSLNVLREAQQMK